MKNVLKQVLGAGSSALFLLGGGTASAGPYVPITNPVLPIPTDGVPAGPKHHPGKEYSHELDRSSTAAGVATDAQQNTKWDGSGGVDDTFDYDGADEPSGEQVDAIANAGDALFDAVVANETAVLFSERMGANAQGAGSDTAAPIYYETTGGSIGTWASWAQVDQHGGENLDGLEVWGPEGDGPGTDDANRYSLFGDSALGTSIYNLDGSTYLTHAALAGAVLPFLAGEDIFIAEERLIDLDALMVKDYGSFDIWDSGDEILFSLWPIVNADPTMSLVGDLVIHWDFDAGMTWLHHGSHDWYDGWLGYNVDALEAAAPEPGSLALLGLGLAGLAAGRRRYRKRG